MQSTPYTNAPRIRLRPRSKIATTGITNELADAVNSLRTLPPFGQKIDPVSGMSTAQLPTGQYPGTVYQVIAPNQMGIQPVSFMPPIPAIPQPAV